MTQLCGFWWWFSDVISTFGDAWTLLREHSEGQHYEDSMFFFSKTGPFLAKFRQRWIYRWSISFRCVDATQQCRDVGVYRNAFFYMRVDMRILYSCIRMHWWILLLWRRYFSYTWISNWAIGTGEQSQSGPVFQWLGFQLVRREDRLSETHQTNTWSIKELMLQFLNSNLPSSSKLPNITLKEKLSSVPGKKNNLPNPQISRWRFHSFFLFFPRTLGKWSNFK